MYLKLFFTFYHYDMISKFCFHWWICINRRCQIRNWQCKGSILKGSYHGTTCHPTKITLQIINKMQNFRHNYFQLFIKMIFFRYIHVTPDLALSSLYVAATSLNFWPAFNFPNASNIFDCFSHSICLTCIYKINCTKMIKAVNNYIQYLK